MAEIQSETTTIMISKQTHSELKRFQRRVLGVIPATVNYSLGDLVQELLHGGENTVLQELKDRNAREVDSEVK